MNFQFKRPINRYIFTFIFYLLSVTLIAVIKGEVRPFFNGKWFYKTPFEMTDYGLLVTSIHGKSTSDTVYLEDIAESQLKSWKFDAYVMTQKVGQNFADGNTTQYEKSLSQLDHAVVRGTPMKLILQRRTFDTIEYIEAKKLKLTKNLKAVQFGN